MPLMILAIAFFLVAMSYLKRYSAGGPNQPRFSFGPNPELPGAAVEFRSKLDRAMEDIEGCVLAPSRLGSRDVFLRTGTGVVVLVICWVILSRHAAAFERNPYNLAGGVMLSFVLFWLAIGCYDLNMLWRRLHTLLDLLELLRLQDALKRVSRDWPRRPVWAFRQSVSKNFLNRQMIYALHGRVVSPKPMEEPAKAVDTGSSREDPGSAPTTRGSTIIRSEKDLEELVGVLPSTVGSAPVPRFLDVVRGISPPGAAHELDRIGTYEKTSADIAARILQLDLRPFWRISLEQEEESGYLRYCADFVALQSGRYVAHNVEHVRRMAYCISLTFLLLLLLFFNSYSPEGPQIIARFLAVLFVIISYLVVRVLAAMERNPILSTISRTKPGELNYEFWMQLVGLGGLPLLGVLAHLFPSLSQFLFRWIAPGVHTVH